MKGKKKFSLSLAPQQLHQTFFSLLLSNKPSQKRAHEDKKKRGKRESTFFQTEVKRKKKGTSTVFFSCLLPLDLLSPSPLPPPREPHALPLYSPLLPFVEDVSHASTR